MRSVLGCADAIVRCVMYCDSVAVIFYFPDGELGDVGSTFALA